MENKDLSMLSLTLNSDYSPRQTAFTSQIKFEQGKIIHRRTKSGFQRYQKGEVSYLDFLVALQGLPSNRSFKSQGVSPEGSTLDPLCQKRLEILIENQQEQTILSSKAKESIQENRTKIPVYGGFPCSAYCLECDRVVHTQVGYKTRSKISKGLLALVDQVCCQRSDWLESMKVHVCPVCMKVLARVQLNIKH